MFTRCVYPVFTAVLICLAWLGPSTAGEAGNISKEQFIVYPIGQVRKEAGRTKIVIDRKFQAGLLGLEKFSHIHVLYWFDRNDTPQERSILQLHPRGDRNRKLSGVFATRAPVRPNLIALSLCKIVSIRENIIEIESIDAFPNTPVLDIKPYVQVIDAVD